MDNDIYNLSQNIEHHKNTLRSISANSNGIVVTGSFDKTCGFMKRTDGVYNFYKDTKYHEDYIYIVRSNITNTAFFTGAKDSKIILMDNEGNPLAEFIGHSGTVNSISQADQYTFISGSWDATARVWDVETGKCKYVLKDHSHAVATLALEGNRYITGSQDKKLKFWDGERLVHVVENAHDDIIRDIILNDDMTSIYTCSNDMSIKLWTLSGELVQTITGHDGFIFRLLKRNGLLFSAGDDKVVKVWKNGQLHQDLFHPNTVWDMTFDDVGDLITACADGIARVFTTRIEKWLSQQDLDDYVNMCLLSGAK
jgi:phospholipase A-2-activating protein